MSPARSRPTNAMLYTLIAFVGLFIVATVIAVIYYLKAEKHRTEAASLRSQIDELATSAEIRNIGAVVGAKQPRKTRLGTMVDYLDQMVSLTIGGLPEDTSAEVKVDTADRKTKDIIQLLSQLRTEIKTAPPTPQPANEFVELLTSEQFIAATETFDQTMKDQLPPEKLQEIWQLTIDQMGPFNKQLGARTEKQQEFDVVFVTCEFEKGALDVQIVYNTEGQVSGLFFVPTPEETLQSYQSLSQPPTGQQPYIEIADPNTVGLIPVIEKLKMKMDNVTNAALATEEQLKELQNRFDDAMKVSLEKEQTLLAEKEKYQQQVNEIKQDYDELKAFMQKTTDQQVQTLAAQLDEERDDRKRLHQQLLKTEAELKIAESRIKNVQQKLQALVPPPDTEVAAYKPDGKIILIDDAAKIVHLNIGSDERVYRGLTFSVYDKNMPIPKDGKGKAEVEVFNVGKSISAARITRSEPKNPIILDDIIANLIWDSDRTNIFAVEGEFDLNGDGVIDYDGAEKIEALIEKWGGRVSDNVSVDTDFLVLGSAPEIPRKPTFEQIEIDPMAMEKYEESLRKLERYKEAQDRTQTLSIPVFNTERFLYFIGYKEQSARPGAF